MLMSDSRIKQLVQDRNMIVDFIDRVIRKDSKPVLSYGTSSYGYDVRLSDRIQVFSPTAAMLSDGVDAIDPKRFDPSKFLVDATIHEGEGGERYFILPPNTYALGYTIEWFNMPRNTTAVCLGKSTYARAAVLVNATPIEAGFCGQVVIEIGNCAPFPVRVYVDEGIAQFLFLESDYECDVSYGDRNGKYQGQSGITHSKV